MTEADDWADEVIESYAREVPEVLDLAVAVSLASRVEPGLLRRARLELHPEIHAGAESELWYSPLVQHRSPKAMVFAPAAAWRLQRRLKDGERPGLAASWELLRSAHAGLPDAIRLEEEIAWRAVRDAADPEIPILLRRAVRTLMDGETPDLAQWAARALPRLPPPVRRSPEAWLLALAASSRLGGLAVLGEPMPEGLAADELFWIAAQSAAQVPVYLRRKERALFLSLRADDEAQAPSLFAPLTHPVLLEATAEDGAPRLVALRPEGPDPSPLTLGAGGLRLRTAAGEVFRVEVPLEAGDARLPLGLLARSPFQNQGALPPGSPVFVGREKELSFIKGRIRAASILITGSRRIGKTSLLNQIADWAQRETDLEPIFLDLSGCQSESDFTQRLRRSLARFPSDVKDLSSAIEVVRKTGRLPLFLLNEIDGVAARDPSFVARWRGLNDMQKARFLMVGYRPVAEFLGDPSSALFHFTEGLDFAGKALLLRGVTEEAAAMLLDLLETSSLRIRWASREDRAQAYRLCFDRSYGIPWVLQRFCRSLVEYLAAERRDELSYQDVERVVDREGQVVWRSIEDIDYGSLGSDILNAERPGMQLLLAAVARWKYFTGGRDAPIHDPRISARPALGDLGFTMGEAREAVKATVLQLLQKQEREVVERWFDSIDLEKAFRLLTLTLTIEPDPAVDGRFGFFLHILPRELLRQYGKDDPNLDDLIVRHAVEFMKFIDLPQA